MTFAVASVEVVRRRTNRQEHHATLGVHAHDGPDVGAGAVLPRVVFPGLMSGLAGAWNRVKPPDELAGPDVECADGTARSVGGILLELRTDDDQVLVNRRRGSDRIVPIRPPARHSFAKINDAAISEIGAEVPGARVRPE